jgi:rhamnosyltransferase
MAAKLLSVIILYHPELGSVQELISALHAQGSAIVIVDNSRNSHQDILSTALNKDDEYHHLPQNIGLGAGHNIAIQKALKENYEFLVIFDQDSMITPGFIDALINTFREVSLDNKVAAVGPSYTDQRFHNTRRENMHVVKTPTPKRMIISSGSLFSVAALKEVGLMDEDLFIDFIDTEWCYRAAQKGYQVYQSATAVMEHHLGEMQPIFFGLYKMRYMKPIRYYYFTRNLRRLSREKRISKATIYSGYLRHLPNMLIKALFLKNTKAYFKNFIKALRDNQQFSWNTLKHEIFLFLNKPNKNTLTVNYAKYVVPHHPAILLVSHELSNTGAPKALFLLAQALKEKYNLILASPKDGPMRKEFAAINVPIIIDPHLLMDRYAATFTHFAKNFDLVIMNTILCAPVAKLLSGKVKTIWWLHEAKTIHEFLKTTRLAVYKDTLIHAKNLYTVSEYAKDYLNHYNLNAKVIELGIPDQNPQIIKSPHNKIVFSMIGAINHKKGVDILVETISKLPKNYQENSVFNIIGAANDPKFFQQLNKVMAKLESVHYHGAMNETEVLKVLAQTDVLICISRDDSFPMVTLEAWMMGVPCILSTTVGTAKYIVEGKNGFIVDNQQPEELLQLLCKIIDHKVLLSELRHQARETFINKFSFEKFATRWRQEVKNTLTN